MLKDSFESIKNSTYDNKKIILTLAGEQADEENFKKIEQEFLKEYKDVFFYVNTTLHPK
jgi:dihydroxyacetone kinase-like predicted kinase